MLYLKSLKWGTIQNPLDLHWQQGEKIVLILPDATEQETLISILMREMMPTEGSIEWSIKSDIAFWRQTREEWGESTANRVLIQYVENLLKALRKYEQLSIQLAKQFSPAQLGGFMEEMEELEEFINSYDAWELEHELKNLKTTFSLPDTETAMVDLSLQDQKKVELAALLGAPQFARIFVNPFSYLEERQTEAIKHKLEADKIGWLLLSTHEELLPLPDIYRKVTLN